jgi:hypothetical protein
MNRSMVGVVVACGFVLLASGAWADKAKVEKQARESKVTLSLTEMAPADALNMIAMIGGVTIKQKDIPKDTPKVTADLKGVSVLEAVRLVTEISSLTYLIVDDGIEVSRKEKGGNMGTGRTPVKSLRTIPETNKIAVSPPPSVHKGFQLREADIVDRMYSMPPEVLRQLKIKGDKDDEWQAAFEKMGVKWPKHSSIEYIANIKKLRVRNTPENFKHLELALHKLYTSASKQ